MSDKKTEELFHKALKAKKVSPSNFQSAVLRIQNANTVADLQKLEKSFDRIYNAGHLSVSEFQRLDAKIMDKIARIESGEHALGSKLPSPRAIEKRFGLQEGETYEYEDAVESNAGKIRLGKHTGEITLNENSGTYTVWVKGIGDVGVGFSKADAIASARSNPKLKNR